MDESTFRDFVDDLKEQADLVREISETQGDFGMGTPRGRYATGTTHDSLVVDVALQLYNWNSRGESGDVFSWLERQRGMGFGEAVTYLATRYQVRVPEGWGAAAAGTGGAAMSFGLRADLLEVVVDWMVRKLAGDAAAVEYVRGRGWTEATMARARLGFTGGGTAAEKADLAGDLRMHGHDPECPVAVAVLGWEGDVRGWGKRWGTEPQEGWVKRRRIYGLLDFPRLIYPHFKGRKVAYISARNLSKTAEGGLDGATGKHKTYNLPVVLGGKRQVFFNQEYMRGAERVAIVEGPADAVTLGQWGLAAVALMGLGARDQAGVLSVLRERHRHVYVGLDADAAGQGALAGPDGDWPWVRVLGAFARVLRWPGAGGVKDANDWLQKMGAEGVVHDDQVRALHKRLGMAQTMVVTAAAWAGAKEGAERDDAQDVVMEMVAGLSIKERAKVRRPIARELGLELREYDAILKATTKQRTDDMEPVETLGGHLQDEAGDWLVEIVYDEIEQETHLVYRDPEGRVEMADDVKGVVIGDVRYVPKFANSFIRRGAVLFASELGARKEVRELVAIIETFILKYYLLDEKLWGRVIAYYVLLTWMYDAFEALPYLRAKGDYGSGKSELLKRVGHLCYRFMAAGGSSSESALFRAIEMYKGTLFIDEADLPAKGYEDHPIVKIYNMGAMRGGFILRTEEMLNGAGVRTWEPGAFEPYGPKLIAMRGDFGDPAVASRCITFELMGKEMVELRLKNIPIVVNGVFREEAKQIRNLLLTWRMHNWQPRIAIEEAHYDLEVSARINQVTAPLKALAGEDRVLQNEIQKMMRNLYMNTVLDRQMSIQARIVEALWAIYTEPERRRAFWNEDLNSEGFIFVKHVALTANEILDEMNRVGDDEEEDEGKKNKKELTAKGCGIILSRDLQMRKRARQAKGIGVYWDDIKMRILVRKYGVADLDMSKPIAEQVELPKKQGEMAL